MTKEAPELSPAELATVVRFGLDRPELDLDAIEARANAATEGPWMVMPPLCGPDGQGVYQESSLGPVCEVGDPYPRGDNRPQESMDFIAAARTDVPALVAEVRRLRGLLAGHIEGGVR